MPAKLMPAYYNVTCDCPNCSATPEFAMSNRVDNLTQLKKIGWKWYGTRWIHPVCSPFTRDSKGRFEPLQRRSDAQN